MDLLDLLAEFELALLQDLVLAGSDTLVHEFADGLEVAFYLLEMLRLLLLIGGKCILHLFVCLS